LYLGAGITNTVAVGTTLVHSTRSLSIFILAGYWIVETGNKIAWVIRGIATIRQSVVFRCAITEIHVDVAVSCVLSDKTNADTR